VWRRLLTDGAVLHSGCCFSCVYADPRVPVHSVVGLALGLCASAIDVGDVWGEVFHADMEGRAGGSVRVRLEAERVWCVLRGLSACWKDGYRWAARLRWVGTARRIAGMGGILPARAGALEGSGPQSAALEGYGPPEALASRDRARRSRRCRGIRRPKVVAMGDSACQRECS
jgi:hypothetical protein